MPSLLPTTRSSLAAFEKGDVSPSDFSHREHVRMAFELLSIYDFPEAVVRYTCGLRALVKRAGVPEKFNMTVTVAFMSIIAERLGNKPCDDFDAFHSNNPDIFKMDILSNYYGRSRLLSPQARETFLLPTS